MEFKISGRHVEITPAIHDYARKKTDRLHKYFDRIQAIEAVVQKKDRHFEVEVICDIEHHTPLVAALKAEDVYAAIDQVTDIMERQLTDHKEKLRNRKHIA
ncbi:MAG: ribosome-associated translation inhibitor RaiA [Phycisphaeraceae bacterium]